LWRASGWFIVALIVFLSLVPAPELPDAGVSDKVSHALAYGAVTLWFAGAYREARLTIVAAGAFALGLGLEGVQSLTATRAPEFGDLLANLVGIAAAAGVAISGGREWCAMVEDYLR
jgi:VanZ family protein